MFVFATAGHVDHGKSTLLRALTGMEPDRWAEEKRRGLTLDLGFVWCRTPAGRTVAFVDVPGHSRFVRTMLAGVGPVPAVLFVVAADEGWMPQSTEHLAALHALGVRHGVLVISRCDRAEPAGATREARARLAETSLAGLPVVPISAVTGAGLDQLRTELDVQAATLPVPDPSMPVRLWIDRAFSVRGTGTVVTGTLRSGRIRSGDTLVLHRTGERLVVRGLHCLGDPADSVTGPARVAVNLRNIRPQHVRRGDALVTAQRWWSTDLVDVRVHGEPAHTLPTHLVLHIGSAAQPVRLRPLGPDTARLTLDTALPLHVGDRGLLRDPGAHHVPAGITALDLAPPPLRRRGAARLRAEELRERTEEPDGRAELRRRGLVAARDLLAMGANPPSDAVRVGPWLLTPEHRAELAGRLHPVVRDHQRTHPLDGGLPLAAAQQRLGLPDPALVHELVRADGDVSLVHGRLRCEPEQLPPTVRSAVDELRQHLTGQPFAAPTSAALRDLGLGDAELAAAVRADLLRVLDGAIVLLPEVLDQAVAALEGTTKPFTVSDARRRWATSRRVAVPLLEELARSGRTERLPDGTHRLRVVARTTC